MNLYKNLHYNGLPFPSLWYKMSESHPVSGRDLERSGVRLRTDTCAPLLESPNIKKLRFVTKQHCSRNTRTKNGFL